MIVKLSGVTAVKAFCPKSSSRHQIRCTSYMPISTLQADDLQEEFKRRVLSGLCKDDIGILCLEDPTILEIGKQLFFK